VRAPTYAVAAFICSPEGSSESQDILQLRNLESRGRLLAIWFLNLELLTISFLALQGSCTYSKQWSIYFCAELPITPTITVSHRGGCCLS